MVVSGRYQQPATRDPVRPCGRATGRRDDSTVGPVLEAPDRSRRPAAVITTSLLGHPGLYEGVAELVALVALVLPLHVQHRLTRDQVAKLLAELVHLRLAVEQARATARAKREDRRP